MIFESFTTVLSNGTEAEVVEGGAHIDVTWHNRAAYCAAVRKARLREGSTQTHAVLRGLNSLLPVRLLALLTLSLTLTLTLIRTLTLPLTLTLTSCGCSRSSRTRS